MKPIRLISGIFTVGIWTLLSRVLGVIREVMILGLIGPGPVMDAFVAAFRLPNMFRRFFAEGAFNAAFVPMFSKRVEAAEDPEGFASEAASGLAFVLLCLTGLSLVFMPALVWATAEGFAGTERFDLTVSFGRVVFPYVLFISLAALFSGMLNAAGHFAAAAAAPSLLNLFVILAMGLAALLGGPVAEVLIWTIPFSGIAQLALVWWAVRQAGYRLDWRWPRLTPDMKHLAVVALPAALAGGVMQVNLLVGQQVASNFENAVGWLYAADRLYQLPLGVVGIAAGIVLLPDLSRRLKSGDGAGARDALSRASEFAFIISLPCAVALVVIPLPLVSVLFERGATGPDDSAAIAVAVAIYALGLPAFILQKLLQPIFFAREDTRSPFRYAVWSMVINAVVAIGLSFVIGWLAPAVATSVAGWAMVAMLALGSRRFGETVRFDARFRRRIWRIVLASLAMGLVLWGLNAALGRYLTMDYIRYPALAALIMLGSLSYFAFGQLLGAFTYRDVTGALRRRRA
ncbi:MAG: murein biosynthesis integral membrane protein MurJ [Marinovum algicola]|jgi:putative peptidoglycan lipid II flippase|uniref:Probable lipid II flippase MurJ n=1 Tax=Marinovum algicola TaxID=42444 RepID=A0A975ZNS7_9RHOB|nr:MULTISPECIES: murein biosynthesis integral membrane protein MurJ [Marinovum]AKO95511.1 integral membrane protein MviN [Marinovum algicola DG 898]MDD9743756.1 murein biosynthesis integral membrane protein MurJ [Marinovum sp. PR37]SEJ64332.1 putative peptidoglycan lipid II flippase [Marinovum algicola]SLN52924.1 putative peptidoglycan biosynthesis protein MurJ [Marinovum algicola]